MTRDRSLFWLSLVLILGNTAAEIAFRLGALDLPVNVRLFMAFTVGFFVCVWFFLGPAVAENDRLRSDLDATRNALDELHGEHDETIAEMRARGLTLGRIDAHTYAPDAAEAVRRVREELRLNPVPRKKPRGLREELEAVGLIARMKGPRS